MAKRSSMDSKAPSFKKEALASTAEEAEPPPPLPPTPVSCGRAALTAKSMVGMLREMTEFSVRTVTTAEEWSSEREGQLTEELDAHLRAHRFRDGFLLGWFAFRGTEQGCKGVQVGFDLRRCDTTGCACRRLQEAVVLKSQSRLLRFAYHRMCLRMLGKRFGAQKRGTKLARWTCLLRQATSDMQQTTCSEQYATNNLQRVTNVTNSLQCAANATDSLQCATSATNSLQCVKNATNSLQCAANVTNSLQCAANVTNSLQCAANATDSLQCATNATSTYLL
eukprot:1160256-Pelagomonas_calceolata.AAC.16